MHPLRAVRLDPCAGTSRPKSCRGAMSGSVARPALPPLASVRSLLAGRGEAVRGGCRGSGCGCALDMRRVAEAEMRVAIVTGGARGIGAATAQRLASDGMSVAVVDLDEASCAGVVEEITKAGGRAIGVGADVSDSDAVAAAVARVADELGTPTVPVNNAGVIRDNLLFKMTDSDWDTVIAVHLRGAFLMSRAVQAHMTAAKYGRIVNLSSTSALGNRGQANYAAAKAGLQGFTKTLAIELGPFGVTCNAIAPGFIVTDMTAATAARVGMSFEDFQKAAVAMIPAGRVGVPDDIAGVVSFLVSEDASFVNGQVIYVAGGPRT